jgi:carbon-monoxide dehydrogenase medium subunit
MLARVKAPPFSYESPSTVDEVIQQLRDDPEARVLAGGQSLLPLLALRLAYPTTLIDLSQIPGLDQIVEVDDGIEIGAMATLRATERSAIVAQNAPLLVEALRHVAHPPIRNRGTIGGSLAHGDPAAELPAVARALDASLQIAGPDGQRVISADDFWTGPFASALKPGEILTGVHVPAKAAGWSFQEVARRHGDFAVVLCAVSLRADEGRCSHARIVLGGIGGTPVRAERAEAALLNNRIGEEAAETASEKTRDDLSPSPDVHGSAEYRRHAAGVLVRRTVLEAWGRVA